MGCGFANHVVNEFVDLDVQLALFRFQVPFREVAISNFILLERLFLLHLLRNEVECILVVQLPVYANGINSFNRVIARINYPVAIGIRQQERPIL